MIENHEFSKPKNNLSAAECEGQKWIMEMIKKEELFISKADKGGATLILNYNSVVEEISKELLNEEK